MDREKDSSEFYWLPWLHTYQKLQAATRTGASGVDADLKLVQRWLQEGAARFKPPSEQSAAKLKQGGNLKASDYGTNKGVAIDKQLVQATLELSQLLVTALLLCWTVLRMINLQRSQLCSCQQKPLPNNGDYLALQQSRQAASARLRLSCSLLCTVYCKAHVHAPVLLLRRRSTSCRHTCCSGA